MEVTEIEIICICLAAVFLILLIPAIFQYMRMQTSSSQNWLKLQRAELLLVIVLCCLRIGFFSLVAAIEIVGRQNGKPVQKILLWELPYCFPAVIALDQASYLSLVCSCIVLLLYWRTAQCGPDLKRRDAIIAGSFLGTVFLAELTLSITSFALNEAAEVCEDAEERVWDRDDYVCSSALSYCISVWIWVVVFLAVGFACVVIGTSLYKYIEDAAVDPDVKGMRLKELSVEIILSAYIMLSKAGLLVGRLLILSPTAEYFYVIIFFALTDVTPVILLLIVVRRVPPDHNRQDKPYVYEGLLSAAGEELATDYSGSISEGATVPSSRTTGKNRYSNRYSGVRVTSVLDAFEGMDSGSESETDLDA